MIPQPFDLENIHAKVFVLGDNIDTDQIIPAHYLTWVPTRPDEYLKLGSKALDGLPSHEPRYVEEGQTTTPYAVIIAGKNFGCGSSREHAPIALGAAGCRLILAQSYARIFFRNCMATGELFPIEYDEKWALETQFKTGDEVVINLNTSTLTRLSDASVFPLRDAGDAKSVIAQGGLFAFARREGIVQQ